MNHNGIHRKKDSARIVWDSKPRRAPNPKDIEFQTAEVVIPNPETAGALPLSFRDKLLGEEELDKQKMNRLIWGDNLLAMQALLNQGYEGKINLIYIDPPFDSKADYSHKIKLSSSVIPASSSVIPAPDGARGQAPAGIQSADFEITKEPSVIERLAYKDTWAGGTDSYLDMLYPRLQLMRRLLAPDGSIYVHLDWHVGHYVKVMMDEIFGRDNFVNEIVWYYRRWNIEANLYARNHDVIFLYAKNFGNHKWNQQYINKSEKSSGQGRAWQSVIDPETGKRKSILLDEPTKGVPMPDVWEVSMINPVGNERLGYGTQKPEALIERILRGATDENDLMADFFCGSGTALAVAEKLNRRWIGCELGKVGIQVTRGRLVEQKSKPFLIENIGNYQREMIYLGGARIYEMQKIILKLYGAEPMANRKDLGVRKIFSDVMPDSSFVIPAKAGIQKLENWMPDQVGHDKKVRGNDKRVKGNDKPELELVYCGYPDRAVAAHKVEDLATEAQTLDGAGYRRLVILAWDYEYNYDELLQTRVKAAGKDLKTEIVSRQIPPDIYEYLKQAKSEEDIERLSDKVKFLEKPYLKLQKPEVKGDSVTIGIEKYVLYDFPLGSGKKADEDREELMRLVKDNFAILIDYWAVDWDYDGLTFKSQWQDLRGNGRKAKIVMTEKEHSYLPAEASAQAGEKSGKHTIAVRVVDIFGNDATATIDVKL